MDVTKCIVHEIVYTAMLYHDLFRIHISKHKESIYGVFNF